MMHMIKLNLMFLLVSTEIVMIGEIFIIYSNLLEKWLLVFCTSGYRTFLHFFIHISRNKEWSLQSKCKNLRQCTVSVCYWEGKIYWFWLSGTGDTTVPVSLGSTYNLNNKSQLLYIFRVRKPSEW